MRIIITLVMMVLPHTLMSQQWEDRQLFNEVASGQHLRIISSTDTSLFAPVIERFVSQFPDIGVEYGYGDRRY